jgi:tRNA pseudouridine38-40 synthase
MKNIKLLLAYDGTDFLGWQNTGTGPSIEKSLKEVLQRILQEPIHLQAASRTDRGVHAIGQTVNFLSSKSLIDYEKLQRSLNQLLTKSIVVRHIEEAPFHFHPSLDAIEKTYLYQICFGRDQLPQFRYFSWHVPLLLNLHEMQRACHFFLGSHDFSAFCNARKNLQYSHRTRTVKSIIFHQEAPDRLLIEITANHFLYKMVRNIVGTLITIAKNRLSSSMIPHILSSQNRTWAGMTAPAHGLTLKEVTYPVF